MIAVVDANDLYEVPILLDKQKLCVILLKHFNLNPKQKVEYPILGKWKALTRRLHGASKTVRVALVGKYTKLNDAYLSVLKVSLYLVYYTFQLVAV